MRDGIVRVDEILARRKRQRAGAGRAHRGRSPHRRGARARRRPLLQPVAVQPRGRGEATAGLGLQAVRLPGCLRARGRRGPQRHHAGHARDGRADDVRLRRGVEPEQLRGRVRRGDHVPARAGDVAQHRDDPRRRARRASTTSRRLWEQHRRRRAAARVSRDHARRLRSVAVRHRHRVHHLPERRRAAAAARAGPRGERGARTAGAGRAPRGASPGPTRRSS